MQPSWIRPQAFDSTAPPPKSRFKVGDRVKWQQGGSWSECHVAADGTVLHISGEAPGYSIYYHIRFDGDSGDRCIPHNDLGLRGEDARPSALQIMAKPGWTSHSLCHCAATAARPDVIHFAWKSAGGPGSHLWSLACFAALRQVAMRLRGEEVPDAIYERPSMTQYRFDSAWKSGFGCGAYFGGSILGKQGAASWVGPADAVEALASDRIDGNLLTIHVGAADPPENAKGATLEAAAREEVLAAILALSLGRDGRFLPILLQAGEGVPMWYIMGVAAKGIDYHLLLCNPPSDRSDRTDALLAAGAVESVQEGADHDLRWVAARRHLQGVRGPFQLLVTQTATMSAEHFRAVRRGTGEWSLAACARWLLFTRALSDAFRPPPAWCVDS